IELLLCVIFCIINYLLNQKVLGAGSYDGEEEERQYVMAIHGDLKIKPICNGNPW
ncbi:hypothetical protein A2U01_0090690, partial [Trifolium medium]|nr:hypothetical protein [Trifolium medium]